MELVDDSESLGNKIRIFKYSMKNELYKEIYIYI